MRAVVRLQSKEILVVFSIGICFSTALLAEKFGYSVALGAFIAGVVVAESGHGLKVEHAIHPVRDMFAAIFFVSIGMTVDPDQAFQNLPFALIVFAVVILAQFLSISTAGVLSGAGLRTSLRAGLALGQIGEFAFILAGIGIAAGAARESLQPILVTVAVMTAFTTPLFLKLSGRIVQQIDRRLPHRLQHLLSLYEGWLERFRNRSPAAKKGKPVQRAIRVLAFDAVALTALLGAAIAFVPSVSIWLAGKLQLGERQAFWIVDIAVLVAGVPLLLGLVRNTLKLSRLVGKSILPEEQQLNVPSRIAVQALRVMVYFGVVLGVGAPMIALLRPLTGRSYGVVLLSTAVLALVVYLWRSAGRVEREFQSAAEQIAQVLASQSGETDSQVLTNPQLLPGLDTVIGIRVPKNGYAVGRSLTQLELRARTGATVVAIRREGARVLVPTGREPLQAGDLLAVMGNRESVKRARELIEKGPRMLDTPPEASPQKPGAGRD
jgi:CPA2 family monovalent cation:H+ antiporter-2